MRMRLKVSLSKYQGLIRLYLRNKQVRYEISSIRSLTSDDLIILTKQTGKIWGPPLSLPAPPGSHSPSAAPWRSGTVAGGCHTGASTWGGPPPPRHWGRRGRWDWCWPALSVASRCGSYTAGGTGSSDSSPPGPWTLLFSGL